MDCRPSQSYQWSNCSASPLFRSQVPEEPATDAAREGTCAAWVAECVLKGDANSCEDLTGETHANGWLITPDMVNYVQEYVDMLRSRGGKVTAEQPVMLSPYIKGTLDGSVSETPPVLYVDDLKYGIEIVEPWELPQLIIYGAGEFLRLGSPSSITEVHLGIYQPRAYHHAGIHRVWKITVPELMEKAAYLVKRAELCQAPNPVATPGPWCRRCTAKIGCEANAHSVYNGYNVIESTYHRQMTDKELAAEMTAVDFIYRLVKMRRDALEAETESRFDRGAFIPGWFRKERKGNRAFTVDANMIEMLTGVKPFKTVPMTPPDLEREGIKPVVVNKIAKAPVIGYKLERLPQHHFAKVFANTEGK